MTRRRVAIVGGSGNVGTAVLSALAAAEDVGELTGVARRQPDHAAPYSAARWVSCDVGAADAAEVLTRAFDGVDAVISLGWALQPTHDLDRLWRTNVLGTQTVIESAARAGVPHVLYASSLGTYAQGPKDYPVDESWAATGVPASWYSRQKAEVEAWLDELEAAGQGPTITRLRPGLVFQRSAGSEIGRYFLGRVGPSLVGRVPLPGLPLSRSLVFQAVHADDLAQAFLAALRAGRAGAYNIAADPVLGPEDLAHAFRAHRFWPVPLSALRLLADLTWRLHLQPTSPDWLDLAAAAPVMDCTRAQRELGWTPTISATAALAEVVAGMRDGAGSASPPMRPR